MRRQRRFDGLLSLSLLVLLLLLHGKPRTQGKIGWILEPSPIVQPAQGTIGLRLDGADTVVGRLLLLLFATDNDVQILGFPRKIQPFRNGVFHVRDTPNQRVQASYARGVVLFLVIVAQILGHAIGILVISLPKQQFPFERRRRLTQVLQVHEDTPSLGTGWFGCAVVSARVAQDEGPPVKGRYEPIHGVTETQDQTRLGVTPSSSQRVRAGRGMTLFEAHVPVTPPTRRHGAAGRLAHVQKEGLTGRQGQPRWWCHRAAVIVVVCFLFGNDSPVCGIIRCGVIGGFGPRRRVHNDGVSIPRRQG